MSSLRNLNGYADLDINQRVELKGLLRGWAEIAQERLQKSAQRLIYDVAVKRQRRRTNRLKTDWQINEKGGLDNPGVALSSLYYGRFPDQGTGRGAKKGSANAARRAKRWYTPVKNRELVAIRSLLIQRYSLALVSIASRQLEASVTVTL